MIQREHYLRRLGELELERSALVEQTELLNERLASIDKEYTAIRSILSSSSSDGRWTSQSAPLVEIVYNTLKNTGRPLHYRDIINQLQAEAFHISGTAFVQNLIVRLNRDKRFIKTDRGTYGLIEWAKNENKAFRFKDVENTTDAQLENTNLTISRKREIEKIKYILESTDIDIQIAKNNIQALRNKLLGRETEYKLPDNIDPRVASMSFEKKLIKLLEQKEQLNRRLSKMEISTLGEA